MRRKKWLAKIFRKDLTERKLEKTSVRIKIILSASPLSVFSYKVNIKFEKQILPRTPLIVDEVINTMHLISIEQ